ncbi:hypothetical protein [Flavobacterium cerinum]|uniref:Polysaccharide chain length determinant N-terminal domain-containing protein n=1 Tax=Flavobacterium cerinum TaxID=2502784 RepID=A0ABY5IV81_9FLAO|nr:hypothetical protein [Flavobacterium cerinum]UUC46286.1 hypothetical protein NOX80_03565 [Flavobacterium cerinum]
MNNNSNTTNSEDQEIDLSQVSKKIGNAFQSFLDWIFDGILFFKKNIIIISILFVIGAGLGFYVDKSEKVYDNQIIVIPNFESVDYLYSKVELLNAKIKEGDYAFLTRLGVKNPKKIAKIEVEPIIDIYRFIDNSEENFQMIKLMAEDGDMQKILEDPVTSKNYKFHTISFLTLGKTDRKQTLEPLMKFFNDSEYYKTVRKERMTNLYLKIKTNEETINQINGILNQFSANTSSQQKSDKLVYYNENTQLNDVIKTKDQLVNELGYLNIQMHNFTDIIKESSAALNVRNTKSINGKMKLILPVLFVGLFLLFGMGRSFYKKQMIKRNLA